MSANVSHKQTNDLIQSKIYTKETIVQQLSIWRFQKKKIVFTNGCFDIVHRGHIDYLAKAADMGDVLIVGVNSDASVKRLNKGDARPLQDERSRALILAAFSFITAIVVFDEQTPLELIQFLKPDVLVKGADYNADETDKQSKKYIVGADVVKANGGVVKTIEFLEGYSTTAIENKIKGK